MNTYAGLAIVLIVTILLGIIVWNLPSVFDLLFQTIALLGVFFVGRMSRTP